jgi:hypothetical protein
MCTEGFRPISCWRQRTGISSFSMAACLAVRAGDHCRSAGESARNLSITLKTSIGPRHSERHTCEKARFRAAGRTRTTEKPPCSGGFNVVVTSSCRRSSYAAWMDGGLAGAAVFLGIESALSLPRSTMVRPGFGTPTVASWQARGFSRARRQPAGRASPSPR